MAGGRGDVSRVTQLPEGAGLATAVLGGAIIAYYSFVGFETSANIAEEVRDVRRVYPRALFGAIATAGLVYLLVALVAPAVVPLEDLRADARRNERKVTVDMIQKTVAEHYSLKQADLISERRARAVARPRQVAMWLAKQITTRSLPDIGRRFGGRDHTTVLHAVRRIEALKGEDATIARDLDVLLRKLRG